MVTDNALISHRLTYILVFKTYFLQYNDIKIHPPLNHLARRIHQKFTGLILNF